MSIQTFEDLRNQTNDTLQSFATHLGQDMSVGTSTSNTVVFDRWQGYRHGTWATPITGTIILDTTGVEEGGCAVVIWNGSTSPTFSGGPIQSYSGNITESGTYSVYIHYLNGRFNVNVFNVSGSVAVDTTPPATMEITSVT